MVINGSIDLPIMLSRGRKMSPFEFARHVMWPGLNNVRSLMGI